MKHSGPGYAAGERVEVSIERIVPGGLGLGRGPHGVVLVELAAPGDLAVVEIHSLRKGVAHGTIVSLRESSPDRVEAPCRWYGMCGGCDFQHLRYEAQLDAKVAIVADALSRVGRIDWTGPIERHAAPRPFGSRTRAELHTDPETGATGFYERRSKRVVDIDRCIVAIEGIDQGISVVRAAAEKRPRSIKLLAGQQEVRSAPAIPGILHGPFWLEVAGIEYLVDPAGFFQSSMDLLPALVDRVVGFAEEGDFAWDLFCGVGLFSLPLARKCRDVIGVELDPQAIRHAVAGARQNGIERTRFEASDVTQWLQRRRQQRSRPDTIVVDPPRTGLGRELSLLVAQKAPRRLVYVSCDPVTLARDLQVLSSTGMQIVDIVVFDLFPQTHHVETVVRLVRADSPG